MAKKKPLIERLKHDPQAELQRDRHKLRLTQNNQLLNRKHKELHQECERLTAENDFLQNAVLGRLKQIQMQAFAARSKRSGNCYNLCATDWHCEKGIRLEHVNGRNEFNPKICKERTERFWQKSVTMCKLYENFSPMDRILLWFGGDMINGALHQEDVENNTMGTTDAVVFFVERALEGLDFINSQFPGVPIDILCSIGNHSRTTKKPRSSGEKNTNWEWLGYVMLAKFAARSWPKMRWLLEENATEAYYQYGEHIYRYQHGTWIKSAGGIGGVSVPLRRKVYTTSKSAIQFGNRFVSRDTVGHFHQYIDSNEYAVVNCLCGADGYTVSQIGVVNRPSQAMQIYNSERGKVMMNEIFVDA